MFLAYLRGFRMALDRFEQPVSLLTVVVWDLENISEAAIFTEEVSSATGVSSSFVLIGWSLSDILRAVTGFPFCYACHSARLWNFRS